MRLFEYEAKKIFKEFGIHVPNGILVASKNEAIAALENLHPPVVIKAQVLVGGRGKAGGVEFADTQQEARTYATEMFERTIRGDTVRRILIEEKLETKNEYYLGVTIDQHSGKTLVMLSTEGGVDIERIVKEKPRSLVSKAVNVSKGFFEFEARDMCTELGLKDSYLKISGTLHKLYRVFTEYDAILAEINPLILTNDDNSYAYAVDAKLEVDDNSLFRHSDIHPDLESRYADEAKIEAVRSGLSYVRLDGDIGVIGSGAGLTMATIDLLAYYGCKAADFLETGGAITEELMIKAVEIILKDERLKALLINLYGGVNPMPAAAKGVVAALRKFDPRIPILVKLIGNEEEEAWEILESANIRVVKNVQTEKAVAALLNLMDK